MNIEDFASTARRMADKAGDYSLLLGTDLVSTKAHRPLEREGPASKKVVSRYPSVTLDDVRRAAAAARIAVRSRIWSSVRRPVQLGLIEAIQGGKT